VLDKTQLDKRPRLVGLSQPFFASAPEQAQKGTTVVVHHHHHDDKLAAINRVMQEQQSGRRTPPLPMGGGKLRVLVADDNSTNIEVVSRMLKLEDIYDVSVAKDGQEAYELVKANMERNQHFDVIFMDIQMPNLDGLQSTRMIRKMGYSAPIVALTAFSEESNVKECMESGMNEFLSKPIRRPALKQVLKKFATILEEEGEGGPALAAGATKNGAAPTTTTTTTTMVGEECSKGGAKGGAVVSVGVRSTNDADDDDERSKQQVRTRVQNVEGVREV